MWKDERGRNVCEATARSLNTQTRGTAVSAFVSRACLQARYGSELQVEEKPLTRTVVAWECSA